MRENQTEAGAVPNRLAHTNQNSTIAYALILIDTDAPCDDRRHEDEKEGVRVDCQDEPCCQWEILPIGDALHTTEKTCGDNSDTYHLEDDGSDISSYRYLTLV